MRLTIRGELVQLAEEDKQAIGNLMRTYSSCKRFAFNRYNDNLTSGERLVDNDLKKQLMETFNLNARYAYAAMVEGKEVVSSQRELLPVEIKDTESKIARSKRKLKKIKDPAKRKGVEARIRKLEQKRNFRESHLRAGTIPHVVFGGKKNFHKMKDPSLTTEERQQTKGLWKDSRTNQLYSIGAKIDNGNQNLRITTEETYNEDGLFNLRINVGDRKWLRVKVWIPPKYHESLFEAICRHPYSVRLKRENGRYHIFVTCDTKETNVGDITNGIAGIDLNTEHIAVSIANKNGNLKAHKVFPLTRLDSYRTNRKDFLIGNTVKDVARWIKSQDVSVVTIENLKFAKRHDTNRRFNRKTSMFAYSKMVGYINSRCHKEHLELRIVDPRFTSLIGRYKYADTYGLSTHEAAAFVIARRGLGFKERMPEKLFTAVKALTPGKNPAEGKDFWSCLYGLDKRDSDRVLRDVLAGPVGQTANPAGTERFGVRISTLPAMTVKPGLVRVGTEDLACIAFDKV
ncbi:MAG: IS200/IS605 family accessory protein TnpB-related protein [Actinobacteria bacterium]|nr:IS200/IS605 family accessory protein TnpB-related protein [Actinomycetota bacterium]